MKKHVTLGLCLALVHGQAIAAAKPPSPETKVVLSDTCLLMGNDAAAGANFIGAVLAVVAPILAELAIDGLSAELKKIRTVKSEGSYNYYLYRSPAPGGSARELKLAQPACITVLTGKFKDPSGALIEPKDLVTTTPVPAGAPLATVTKRLKENGIDAEYLYSAFEAELEIADDGTAYRYKPKYLKVFELMPGNKGSKQGLVYNLSLRGPGAAPNGTVHSLAPISFGEVARDFELHEARDADKLGKLKSGYVSIPAISEASYRSYLRLLFKPGMTDKEGRFMPVNFQAEAVQTQKPSDAAVLLATILDKAKPKISEAVGAALKPSDPFTDSQALFDAKIAVQAAKAEHAAAATDAAKALALLKQQKAEEALAELESK